MSWHTVVRELIMRSYKMCKPPHPEISGVVPRNTDPYGLIDTSYGAMKIVNELLVEDATLSCDRGEKRREVVEVEEGRGRMWHEARRLERKVHDIMDAARKRAQRRAVYIAKRRGDPQQLLQVTGARCCVYRDDGLYQAAQHQQGLCVIRPFLH
ncbi:hypothetical protein GW17_00046261 [Ensete ventricosum]|nr:hypothetical protein GW17_00046261 [Ensete ventricosum]